LLAAIAPLHSVKSPFCFLPTQGENAMIGNRWKFACFVVLVVGGMVGLVAEPSRAGSPERLAKTDAPLVVDGVVRQVFRSPRQGRTDYLLQIEVLRSEGRKSPTEGGRPRFPGPGETMYVHISQRLDQQGQLLPGESYQELPDERSQIRAYLTPREQGGWEGVFPDWFERTTDRPAEATPEDPAPKITENVPARAGTSRLGMTTEAVKVQNQIMLRVTSVQRGGAAQESGLEIGDVIAGAEGAPITNAEQIEALAAKGKKFSLIVVDVNTARAAKVEVDPAQRPASTNEADAPPNNASKVSLGISAEPVTFGTRSALKVTGVDPAGPAAKAGLEKGDIIVAANGAPITGVEQLLGALRKSGPKLKLTVRDTHTGRDAEIEVNLGGNEPTKQMPVEVETQVAASPGKLGAVTELAFHDNDFAVKVTEVEAGSPAARVGLRSGVLILAANGKPMLHPNDLNDAVRTSGGALKLTVFDPSTGQKSTLDVNLGR
jgi:serine protease Do